MEVVLEGRHDAEVAAAAANRPEEVGVLVRAGTQDITVGGDDLDGEQVVDRQPKLAREPAHPAAERQTGDAGVGDHAGRYRQAVSLGRAVKITEQGASPSASDAGDRIDGDLLHGGEIDDETAVARAVPRCGVASPTDGDGKGIGAGEGDGVDYIV